MDKEMIDIVFVFIGKVVAVGGTAAVIAYAIFVFLGKKWLESKFAERLEAYKHKQSKELEEVRYRINAQFNRVTKIHEKEIEVLPQAWSKLNDALEKITYFTSPVRQYPDVDRLSEEQLGALLKNSTFEDWEKNEIRNTDKKNECYKFRIFYHELNEAKKSSVEFHHYIINNSIFLSQDIKDKFISLDDILWKAVINEELDHDLKDRRKLEKYSYTNIQEKAKPIKKEIEALVQKRLQLDQAI